MKTLRHVVAGVFTTLFVLLAGPAFAQTNIRVDGFDVEQVAELSPGTQLNFSIFGTPGAQASLHIDGTDSPVTLIEVQPGVYEGSYTIAEQDRIMPESHVTARLRVRDRVITSVLGEPLLLGMDVMPVAETAAPSIPSAQPALPPQPSFPPPPPPVTQREPVFAAAPYCAECGVVEAIERTGHHRGRGVVGTMVGGVVGAIVGSQVGRGDGRRLARILGAIGGAVAGREIERRNVGPLYNVMIRFENGVRQSVAFDSAPPFRVGDRVRFADGGLRPYR
jgi:hypothetical protein